MNSVTESSDSLLISVTPPFRPEAGDTLEYHVSYWENETSNTKAVRLLSVLFLMPLWLIDMSQSLLVKQQKWKKNANVFFFFFFSSSESHSLVSQFHLAQVLYLLQNFEKHLFFLHTKWSLTHIVDQGRESTKCQRWLSNVKWCLGFKVSFGYLENSEISFLLSCAGLGFFQQLQ